MKFVMLVAVIIGLSAGPADANPLDVYGQWRTDDGDAVVAISLCDGQAPCGTVVWINTETVEVNADRNNQDRALRDRPLVGLKMLWGFTHENTGWESGRVYDPDSGRTYRSAIRRLSESELEMKGCLGFICRTQIWQRVEGVVYGA